MTRKRHARLWIIAPQNEPVDGTIHVRNRCIETGLSARRDHMQRREFVTLLSSAVATWPLAARAQQPDGMRRIAVLMDTEDSNSDGQTRVAALRQTLQQLGWTEGRNI